MPHKPPKKPSRLSVHNTADGLTIEWRWLHPSSFVLLLFVYLPTIGGLAGAFSLTTNAAKVNPDWAPALRGGLALAALAATWFIVAAFVNRTTVRLGRDFLTVKHAPLWCPGNRRFETADVTGFYLEIDTSNASEYDDRLPMYTMLVKLHSTFPHSIIKRIPDEDEAGYLKSVLAGKLQAYAHSQPRGKRA